MVYKLKGLTTFWGGSLLSVFTSGHKKLTLELYGIGRNILGRATHN